MCPPHEYVGNIHIHSTYSDGSGSIDLVATKAREVGLDFVVITDHSTLRGKTKEGYHYEVLVLVGMEVNRQCNHYLAMNVTEEVPDCDENPQAVIDEVQKQGGLGFLAHPVEKGSPLYERGKTYPWTDWQVTGFTGVELWNCLSQWRDGIIGFGRGLYLSFFNPHRALTGPDPDILARWDRWLEGGLVTGIGGSDAHAIKVKLGPITFTLMDYRFSFQCINTHVLAEQPLTGDVLADAQVIYRCLAEGRCFIAYDYFYSARGFRFYASDGGRQTSMGGSIAWSPALTIQAQTPFPAQVRLINRGQLCRTSWGENHSFNHLVPGIYRLEAFHRQGRKALRPWIFSNPIYITE